MQIGELMQHASGLIAEGRREDALSLLAALLVEGGLQAPYVVGEQVAKLTQQLGDAEGAAAIWEFLSKRAHERNDVRGQLHAALAWMRSRVGEGEQAEARLIWVTFVTQVDPEHSSPRELIRRAAAVLKADSQDARTLASCEAARTIALYFGSSGRFERARAALDVARRTARLASERARPWTLSDESALYAAELAVDAGQFSAAATLPPDLGTELSLRWRLLQVRARTLAGDFTSARVLAQELRASSAGTPSAEQAAFALGWVLLALNRLGDLLALVSEVLETPNLSDVRRRRFEQLESLARLKARIAERDEPLAFVPEQVLSSASLSHTHREERLIGYEQQSARFLDRWGACANSLLLALARQEAASEALGLARTLSEKCDSKLVQAKQAYLNALVAYYTSPARANSVEPRSQHALLEQVRVQATRARELAEELGLAADAWQASRLEAWCTRTSREAYEAARQRSQLALVAIESRLDDEDRVYFSLNKNSARDEYLVTRLRRAADAAAWRPSVPLFGRWFARWRGRRKALAAFESLAMLTQWSVERGLDMAPHAVQGHVDPAQALAGHQVEHWVTNQLALRRTTRARLPWLRLRRPVPLLRHGEALVQYYVAPEATFVTLLTRDNASVRELRVTRVALDLTVSELHRALQNEVTARATPGKKGAARAEQMRQVRERAIADASRTLGMEELMATLPASVHTLFIVPHDVLCNLPFGALRGEGQALIARVAISLLPSSRFLERVQHDGPMRSVPDLLAVGIEDFAPRDLRPLAHTIPEAQELADLFGELGGLLLDPLATPAQLSTQASSFAWLHLATHGEFDVSQPHASRLHLATSGGAPTWLSVGDVARAAWGRLRGVTLSACTASVQVPLPGQELVGFPAAFLHAGLRHVVAPLWRVEDAVGRLFMSELYESAKTRSPLEALAHVQRQWSASLDSERNLPFRWAGFAHHGC